MTPAESVSTFHGGSKLISSEHHFLVIFT